MTISVVRDGSRRMKHVVHVRQHAFTVDEPPDNGGEDLGVTAHELYDSALGTCKAMTVLWYAQRKQIPVEDIRVTVDRDDSQERQGLYRLHVTLHLTGALTATQREQLLAVADKCPLHKLMSQVRTEISTVLAPPAPTIPP
jgi:putative redox protein